MVGPYDIESKAVTIEMISYQYSYEIGTWSEHPNYSFIQTEMTIIVSK